MLQLLDGGQPGAARLGGLASGQRNLPLQQDVTPPANSSRVAATDSEHPDHAAALAEFRDTYGDDARLAELDVTPFDLDEIKDTLGLLGLGDDRHHAEPPGISPSRLRAWSVARTGTAARTGAGASTNVIACSPALWPDWMTGR